MHKQSSIMVYSFLYIITALAIIIFSQNRTCTKSLVYKIFDSIEDQSIRNPIFRHNVDKTKVPLYGWDPRDWSVRLKSQKQDNKNK